MRSDCVCLLVTGLDCKMSGIHHSHSHASYPGKGLVLSVSGSKYDVVSISIDGLVSSTLSGLEPGGHLIFSLSHEGEDVSVEGKASVVKVEEGAIRLQFISPSFRLLRMVTKQASTTLNVTQSQSLGNVSNDMRSARLLSSGDGKISRGTKYKGLNPDGTRKT